MSNFWKNYQYLCEKNGKSVYEVATSCGVKGTGTITYWRQGSKPKADTLQKICDYFGVTATNLFHDDLEQKEKTADAFAQAANDPLYTAILNLTAEQRVLVKGFIAGLRANSDMPL